MTQERSTTALTQKSQITLPKRVREHLGLAPGDRIGFEIEGDAVKIVPLVSRLEENFGKVAPRSRPEDYQRIREEFEKGVGEDAGEES